MQKSSGQSSGRTSGVVVRDDPGAHRYAAWLDGRVAGFITYETADRLVTLTHTEVPSEFEGRGVGSALVRASLDEIRASGREVVPVCPFVRSWIDRNPEYADLVHQGSASG